MTSENTTGSTGLVDSFFRKHDYLRISLTDRCNLRCSYCMPYDFPAGTFANALRMDADEIESIAAVFVRLGVKKIRLTGGEPLVRKDAKIIMHLLSRLPVELAVTTNGVFIEDFLDTFLQTGIRSVNVSLDTLNREKFLAITKRNYFDNVMNGITLLLENNFNVKINVVAVKGISKEEIYAFIEWTKYAFLHVRFIEFMPFPGNNWSIDKVVSHHELLANIRLRYPVEKIPDEKNNTARKYRIPGHKGTFAIISSVTEPFCKDCNRLRLTADGKLRNCLFSQEEVDLLSPFRKGMDIRPLIYSCVAGKKEERGGVERQGNWETGGWGNKATKRKDVNSGNNQEITELADNRAMVAIGG